MALYGGDIVIFPNCKKGASGMESFGVKLETTEQRRRNMSRIRSKDTKPELVFRHALRVAGLSGYRKNLRGLPGTPDVVFTKYKLAIFVDGDFWHGRDFAIRRERLEAGNNGAFWVAKIERNMARDTRNVIDLENMGWTVVRFWESDVLKSPDTCAVSVKVLLGRMGYGKRIS